MFSVAARSLARPAAVFSPLRRGLAAGRIDPAAVFANHPRQPQDKRVFAVHDPATGTVLANNVPDMGPAEARAAIAAAAGPGTSDWAPLPAKEKARLIMALHKAIDDAKDDLAVLITQENGKPLAEARGEVIYGNSYLAWFAEEAKRVNGDVLPPRAHNERVMVFRQPVGLCALVTPWNFPLAMLTRKAGAALAAGCASVIKPSEDTPLTAQVFVDLARKVGIPQHTMEIVTCSRERVAEVGTVLATDEHVRKISFTGSTAVGTHLTRLAAQSLKRVSMELGGNAPFIVFNDADLDVAVTGAMFSKFRNNGQTCIASNRYYVHEDVVDAFTAKLQVAMSKLKIGSGLDPATTAGPLINERAVERVLHMVSDAVAKGATLVCGGNRPDPTKLFVAPTIVKGVKQGMALHDSEIFGPVVAISTFRDDADVIRRANDTSAGLAAYFFTADARRMWRVSEQLDYGMVGVNTGAMSNEAAPFGGFKTSGLGREGGRTGITPYLEEKYVLFSHM